MNMDDKDLPAEPEQAVDQQPVRRKRKRSKRPGRAIRRRDTDDVTEDRVLRLGREAAAMHASGMPYKQIAEQQGVRSPETARYRMYRYLERAAQLEDVGATRGLLTMRAERHYSLLLVQLQKINVMRSPFVPGHLKGDELLSFLVRMGETATRKHNSWVMSQVRLISALVRQLGEELERHARIAGVLQAAVNIGPNAGATIGQQIAIPNDPGDRERLAQLCREADGILGLIGPIESSTPG